LFIITVVVIVITLYSNE